MTPITAHSRPHSPQALVAPATTSSIRWAYAAYSSWPPRGRERTRRGALARLMQRRVRVLGGPRSAPAAAVRA